MRANRIMRLNRAKLLVVSCAVICVLAAVGMSRQGRAALNKALTLVAPVSFSPQPAGREVTQEREAAASVSQDVEQRARMRHGWNAGVMNSGVRGTITRYDGEGTIIEQAGLTIYRKYPDRLRIEVSRVGAVEASGFDSIRAWKQRARTVGEEEAREIRALLRMWPERLFVTRAMGASYREVGRRIEDDAVAGTTGEETAPDADEERWRPPVMLEQVKVEDVIGPPPASGRVGDRRTVYYYVDEAESVISSIRWLEPDDPRRRVTEANVSLTDVRVDFSDWREVAGVLWPFEITRRLGGRLSFRIRLSEVLVNQPLPDTIFQSPQR